jgi:hypothetical protein
MGDSGFIGIFSGDCPATGLIFAKPENSSEAARVALPQNAVAIVWRRLAFGISRAIPGHVLAIREPYQGDCTQRPVSVNPLGQDLWTGTRLTFGGQSPKITAIRQPLTANLLPPKQIS